MREPYWLSKIFVGAVAVFAQSATVATVGAAVPNDTNLPLNPYTFHSSNYPGAGLRCYLPVDVGSVAKDELMEVPITKKMAFNFGKPKKMQFVFIED